MTKKDHQSLEQGRRAALLCFALHVRGGLFTVENPCDSMVFRSSPFVLLEDLLRIDSVVFDQCQYNLRPPPVAREGPGGRLLLEAETGFVRKRTKIWANFPEIARMCRTCPGTSPEHLHVHAIGSRRTVDHLGKPCTRSVASVACQYPHDLCCALARCVQAALRNKVPTVRPKPSSPSSLDPRFLQRARRDPAPGLSPSGRAKVR